MLEILFTIGVGSIIVAFILLTFDQRVLSFALFAIGISASIAAIVVAIAMLIKTPHAPTALDVYQGKTTLKVTYIDSVAVDSVVVFKDKEK